MLFSYSIWDFILWNLVYSVDSFSVLFWSLFLSSLKYMLVASDSWNVYSYASTTFSRVINVPPTLPHFRWDLGFAPSWFEGMMSTPFPATHRPQELEWSWRLSAPFMFVWAFRCRMCSSSYETTHMRGRGYHVVSLWIIHNPPDFIVAMSDHSPSFMDVYGVTPPNFLRFNLAFMHIPLILLTSGRCHVYPVRYPYSTISIGYRTWRSYPVWSILIRALSIFNDFHWLSNMTIVPCVIYPNRVFAMRLNDLIWHRAAWLRTSLCQCSKSPLTV